MAELRWTDEALDWLENIHRYIAHDNPRAAAKVIDGIIEKAELLTSFPDLGTRLRIVSEGEVRMILYGHYRIVYLHRTNTKAIEMLGVFHGALDLDRYLP
ncbi:MAG: type II toxin-antitoxin system RelE/ParE family toxin [Pseudomonadota bacterium]|nr:type II toxin-antitoxin system RelE/ParE family toxin [Pseudomonadota bacterium]MDP1906307.1 type II toxin-antitoxin system RelE/ParE family toxin [Pseudomonadota bacterium]MDP2351782.1 type II toxin-antitoxin system RelE/ParE family toxin [Pseudomonadota bacterium]